jgi:hypothetical protein
MDFLKTVGGKIAGGLVAVAVVAAAIALWRMDGVERQNLWSGFLNILAWLGIVALWPWVSFAVIRWVNGLGSNVAGGLLVFGYTAAEAALLLWLCGVPSGPTGWTFAGVGALVAGAYNLLACDWIAEKLE